MKLSLLPLLSLALTPVVSAVPVATSTAPAISSEDNSSSNDFVLLNDTSYDVKELKKAISLRIMANFTNYLLDRVDQPAEFNGISLENLLTYTSSLLTSENKKRQERSLWLIWVDNTLAAINIAAETLANGLDFITPEEVADVVEALEAVV